jgi:hypothetical protein
MKLKRIIGIDFGTSTSFVKVKLYMDEKPFGGDKLETKALVFDGKGSIAVPTVVQKAEEQFWFGYEAEVKKPNGIIYRNFKVELESKDQKTCELAKEMTERFFRYIYEKYDEQRQFLGDAPDEEYTLVSYPAKWQEETRRFMVEAAQKAGFSNVTGMDEATAAIGAVMVQEAASLQEKGYLQADVPATIMLIDMGAGTTDLALSHYTVGATPKNDIIATWPKADGDILFGGREVDEILCETLTEYLAQNGMLESVVNTLKTLRMGEIKSWKEHTVSDTLDCSDRVESCAVLDGLYMMLGMNPPPFPAIDRTKFEEIAHTYLVQYAKLINGCIEHAMEIAPDFNGSGSIDLVVLTGGHSQWYFAKDVLTGSLKSLGDVNLPRICREKGRILSMARPQETVSLGLVYSAMLPEVKRNVGSKPTSYGKIHEAQQEDNLQYGNTCGNIINDGLFAQQGEWIYYRGSMPDDRYFRQDRTCLCKIREDGTGKLELNNDYATYINVVGDWVYYSEGNVSPGGIYKIRTDGTGGTKITDEMSVNINVVGEWIYYKNRGDDGKLYKVRTDGTEKTKLSDDICGGDINVVGAWVYYLNASDEANVYKIRIDGTERTKLNDEGSSDLNVVDGWVYYSTWRDNTSIYKIRTDGTERTKLNDDDSHYINVADGWAFYSNWGDNQKIYKIRTDGTERTKLIDDKLNGGIHIVGGWIYYNSKITTRDSFKEIMSDNTYRIRLDGTCRQVFEIEEYHEAGEFYRWLNQHRK